jgi:hypothetical protein
MKLFDYIVDRLIARAQKTPYFTLPGYMERFWLVPYTRVGSHSAMDGVGPVSPWKRPLSRAVQLLNIAARIHHILRSDLDRHMHNHPWWYVTVILRGGYYEVTPLYDMWGDYVCDIREWHGPGSVLFRRANSLHRIEIPAGQTAWTLFITGKYSNSWGFAEDMDRPDEITPYREYLDAKK